MLCPCCSERPFASCCEPLLIGKAATGKAAASSPEALMRSRYSAYSRGEIDYIYATYATATKVQHSKQEISDWANSVTFVRLEVLSASDPASLTDGDQGYVEFCAHYLQDKTLHKLHEKSRFIREQQQWRYIDGTIIEEQPLVIGRNDLCPCLSGKKFKKCHS